MLKESSNAGFSLSGISLDRSVAVMELVEVSVAVVGEGETKGAGVEGTGVG